jgi:mono/diheme cytochrome c family protein
MPRLAATAALAASAIVTATAYAADGAAVFAAHCAACHQADGTGVVGLAPPLKGDHWKALAADRAYILRVVTHGLSGPIKVGGNPYMSAMPPQAQLADDEVAAAASHVVGTLNSDVAPSGFKPYDAAEVAAVRAMKLGAADQAKLRKQLVK